MRVLMLTDDSQIDRRIIAEAQTLACLSHEVIVIAGPSAGVCFEREGEIKIERWQQDSYYEYAARDRRPLALTKHALKVIRHRLKSSAGEAPGGWTLGQALWQIEPFTVAGRAARYAWATIRIAALRTLGAVGLAHRLPRRLFRATVDAEMAPLERWKMARIRFYRPDVIHAHDLPQLRTGVLAKLELGVPLVYDAHEIYPEIHTLSLAQAARLGKLERRYISFADARITVNEFIAREIAARYRIAPPKVIWNAVDPPDLSDAVRRRKSLRELAGLGPEASVLLFQGWLSPGRGLRELVESMAKVEPRIHLILLGYGTLGEELARIARSSQTGKRVHLLDAVPQSELIYLTATADAGIIPYQPVDLNNRLCSPNKLFEYIQARVPVIANDLPFLSQIVGGEGFGIVAKLDTPENFAKAIAAMFDPAAGGPTRFWPRLAAAADRFSWKAQERTLLDIYRELLPTAAPTAVGGH